MSLGRRYSTMACALVVAAPWYTVSAQSVTATLAKLTSSVDSVRANAFVQLAKRGAAEGFPVCSPSAGDDIKRSLIAALATENSFVYGSDGHSRDGEGDEGEFHGNLIGCVSGLRDDRAVHALVGAIDSGWGALHGILDLGDAAVPEVISAMRATRNRISARAASARTLGRFLLSTASNPVSDATRATIRAALLGVVSDKDPFVRAGAVGSLTAFPDAEASQAIRAAVASDTGIRIGVEPRKFLTRTAAREWMRQDSLKALRPPPGRE
jgi:hypothetical protein